MEHPIFKRLSFLLALLLILCMLCSCALTIPGDGTDTEDGIDSGSESCTHVDTNKDGACDDCREVVFFIIDFYAINDLHGKLFDTEEQPGVDELTTYLKSAYETDEHVIVLAGGDMWQGTAESNLTRGEMMTEWMNEIGTVSMTLGNHEFDWATDYIESNLALANFPFLAINIYDTDTGMRVDYATPSVIVERGGAKIGIIGAIGDCYSSISADRTVGIEFKTGRELTRLVTDEAARLREAGCDFIVYSLHDGMERHGDGLVTDKELSSFYDIALSRGVVDLVFEAHIHQNYVVRDSRGVYHLQAGGENRAISHVEIVLNIDTDEARITEARTVSSYVYDDYTSDDIVDTLADKYSGEIAKGEEFLTRLERTMSSRELAQLCADLYYEEGVRLWGDEYDIVLAGSYIKTRSPYDLEAGDVLYKDIYSLFPFDNDLYLCTISGKKLRDQFLSGRSNYYIKKSEDFPNDIDPSATYYVVADGYSVFYSYNGLTPVHKHTENLFARDFIAAYFKKET